MRSIVLLLLLFSTSFNAFNQNVNNCTSAILDHTNGRCSVINSPNCGYSGDPVNTGTGTYGYNHTDLSVNAVNGQTAFKRHYNSANNTTYGPLGYGWNHNFGTSVENLNNSDSLWRVTFTDSHSTNFSILPGNQDFFPISYNVHDSLSYILNGYELKMKDQTKFQYDSTGTLTTIADRNGNTTQFIYSGGLLQSIIVPGGRSFQLSYNPGSLISSVTDDLGKTISYSYDPDSNLVTVTDAENGVTSFEYDQFHQMTKIILPNGNTLLSNGYSNNKVIEQRDAYNSLTALSYDNPVPGATTITNPDNSQLIHFYDPYYRLIESMDELGNSSFFAYDSASNVISYTNENGAVITQNFGTMGNLLSRNEPLGKTTLFTYNNKDDLLTIKDGLNNITSFQRDIRGNLTGISYPNATSVSYTVNTLGQRTSFSDANNNVYTYNYSPQGDLISTIEPFGAKSFAYDTIGRIITVADVNNHVTTFVYNNNDKITHTTDALGQTAAFTYDSNSNLLSITNKRNIPSFYTYDLNDRLVSETPGNGGVRINAYDLRNNRIQITDANGHSVAYGYDLKQRIVSYTNKLGGVISYTYDAVGNTLSETQPNGVSVTFSYDSLNRNISASNSLNNTISQTYDLADRITDTYDLLSNHKHFSYDNIGRLISVIDESNESSYYTYDGNGNTTSITDPNGHTQTIAYNAINKAVSLTDASLNNETRTYDGAGNLLSLNKANGVHCSIQYDPLNRPAQLSYSTGENYSFSYDANSNITAAVCPAGTEIFGYDSLDLLKSFTDVFNNTINYNYDLVGNRTKIIYPGNHAVNYTFNQQNEIKTVSDWNGNVFTYNYDNAGRQTNLVYPNGLKCDFGFDQAGRLTLKNNYNPSNSSIISNSSFVLDAAGNRVTEQRTGLVPSQLLPAIYHQQYTNDDQLLADSINIYTNDASGNRLTQKNNLDSVQYTFTANSLLASILNGGITTLFQYDAFGNRIRKIKSGDENRYVLDMFGKVPQVISEQNAAGNTIAHYIYGNGLLERIDPAGNELFYHVDATHNVIALSNSSGTITDTYIYEPFGKLLVHTGTTDQPFCFLGEYGVMRENDSLYYCRARYYDATQGRFLGKDVFPFSYSDPQTINRYVYGLNNALSIYDYTGLDGDRDDDNDQDNCYPKDPVGPNNNIQDFLEIFSRNIDMFLLGAITVLDIVPYFAGTTAVFAVTVFEIPVIAVIAAVGVLTSIGATILAIYNGNINKNDVAGGILMVLSEKNPAINILSGLKAAIEGLCECD